MFSIRGKLLIFALEIAAAAALLLSFPPWHWRWESVQLAFAAMAILVIAFAALLGGSIVATVDELVRATRRISGGDYDTPVAATSGDELGALAGEIDHMRRTLRQKVHELEDLNQGLEHSVAERTDALRRAHDRLSLLHETTTAVQSSLDVREIFEAVIAGTRRLVDFHQASLARVGEGDTATVFAFSPSGGRSEEGRSIVLASSRLAQAVAEKRTIVFDVPKPLPGEDSLRMSKIRREAVIPLVVGDAVIGTFNLGSRNEAAFDAADLEVLTSIGAALGVALLRAEAFERERKAALELRNLSELKSAFIARVSHELRTPLTAILGGLDNLLDGIAGPIGERGTSYLQRMRTNAGRLLDMIEELLDLARIEAGKEELRARLFRVDELVGETLDGIRPLAEARGIAIGADVEPIEIIADRDKLGRVLVNLLDNALRFTAAGGRVEVAAREHAASVGVSVSDTGCGISADDLERVFTPFHRAQGSQTRRRSGTGLGLAICRELVEMHGGTIRVESKPGVGSTFTIDLPRGGPTSTAAPEEPWHASSSSTTTRTSSAS